MPQNTANVKHFVPASRCRRRRFREISGRSLPVRQEESLVGTERPSITLGHGSFQGHEACERTIAGWIGSR